MPLVHAEHRIGRVRKARSRPLDLCVGHPKCGANSLAWRTGRTIGYWWAYRSPSPTSRDPDHYVRRLISGLFVGLGVYVLFWPTVVLLLILAVSFGY
jgi:hypothetical protein